MKTILHIITGLNTGGAEMMLYKLLSRVSRANKHVVLSLAGKGTVGPLIESLGIPLYTLELKSSLHFLRELVQLAGTVRKINPSLIQGWMYHGNFAATCTSLACGKPPVLWNIRQSLYSLSYEKRSTAYVIRTCALLSKLPAGIIYNAKESASLHQQTGFFPNSTVIIPNGFDTQTFCPDPLAKARIRAELGIPEDSLVVGLVARFHPMKDHENFLKAAALVNSQHQKLHFILAGKDIDCDNVKLKQLSKALGLGANLHLLGERTDVPQLTASFDIAGLSSFAEAFPNVVGEAMACEIPCVVTAVGDSAEIVGKTGVVVPPRDPQALSAAWSQLIRMPSRERQELGRMARQRIQDFYSLNAVIKMYDDLYSQLL